VRGPPRRQRTHTTLVEVLERNQLMEMTITRQELTLVRDLAYDMKQALPAAPAQ